MDDPLISLSLTHVKYNPADHLSHLSAWLALVPQALCVVYVTLIWSTREIEILLQFAGQLACEVLNFGLKRWIREERPQQMHGKGYGMPSSHAQFVSFFSVSLTLFLLVRHQPSAQHLASLATPTTPSNKDSSTLPHRIALCISSMASAALVCWSRIYLSYHTPRQVLVGVLAGTVSAIVWFVFVVGLRRTGWVEWGLDTWVVRTMRFRDLICVEDLQDAGWERWEGRRRMVKRAGGKSR